MSDSGSDYEPNGSGAGAGGARGQRVTRHAKYCATIHYNPGEGDAQSPEEWLDLFTERMERLYDSDKLLAGVMGLEKASTGQWHLQCAFTFARRYTLEQVKAMFECGHMHLEPMRDRTGRKAYKYCKKDGKYTTVGEQPDADKPALTYEQRRELKRQASEAANANFMQLIKEDPFVPLVDHLLYAPLYKQHRQYWQEVQAKYQREAAVALRDVRVFVFWGNTGTGKTWKARQMAKQLYPEHEPYMISAVAGTPMWWDQYNGEKVIILDDLSVNRERSITMTELKRLLDKYPCRLAVKGSHTMAKWDTVYITTNENPTTWFQNDSKEDYAAVQRRLHVIEHMTEPYEPIEADSPVPPGLLADEVLDEGNVEVPNGAFYDPTEDVLNELYGPEGTQLLA